MTRTQDVILHDARKSKFRVTLTQCEPGSRPHFAGHLIRVFHNNERRFSLFGMHSPRLLEHLLFHARLSFFVALAIGRSFKGGGRDNGVRRTDDNAGGGFFWIPE